MAQNSLLRVHSEMKDGPVVVTLSDVADDSRANVSRLARGGVLRRIPPHIVFLVIAGINVLLLVVLIPPFQVHDEFQDLFRSYQLSELNVWGTVQDGHPGGVLPSALPEFVKKTWGTLRVWYIPPLGRHPLTKTWAELRRPLSPHKQQFSEFVFTTYSPILYIPQTFGVAIGRLLGASPLVLMLLGRLANAAAALAVIAWSLKVLPVGRIAALTIALLPMAQYEYASLAPDAMIIAAGFLFTAVVLRASMRGLWTRTDIVTSAVAAAILCCKLVYAPLLTIGLPATLRRYARGDSPAMVVRSAVSQLLVAVFAIGTAVIWLVSTSSIMNSWASPAITVAREMSILRAPWSFAGMLISDVRAHGFFYLRDTVGIFGAWTVYLPPFVFVSVVYCLLFSLLLEEGNETRIGVRAIAWNLLAIFSSIALVQTAMFIINNPDGLWRIFGVQGRYFLPLGPLAAATLASFSMPVAIGRRSGFGYRILLVLIAFNTIAMDGTIVVGFHLL